MKGRIRVPGKCRLSQTGAEGVTFTTTQAHTRNSFSSLRMGTFAFGTLVFLSTLASHVVLSEMQAWDRIHSQGNAELKEACRSNLTLANLDVKRWYLSLRGCLSDMWMPA